MFLLAFPFEWRTNHGFFSFALTNHVRRQTQYIVKELLPSFSPLNLLLFIKVFDQGTSSPQLAMVTFSVGFPDFVPNFSIFWTTEIPEITFPKTTCFPSSQSVFSVVMKNWEPFVPGPELAMDNVPAWFNQVCSLFGTTFFKSQPFRSLLIGYLILSNLLLVVIWEGQWYW